MTYINGLTISLVLVWFVLLVFVVGIGLLVNRIFGARQHRTDAMLLAFWIGWAAVIGYLQVWHLFWRVSTLTAIPLFLAGAAGLWLARSSIVHKLRRLPHYGILLLILLPLVLWSAGYAVNDSLRYDDGLYHLQDMQWTLNYAIVPGLGNLHGRLAFNTSHNLVLSLVEALPSLPPTQHVVHGLLFLAFTLQVLWSGWQIVRTKNPALTHYLYVLVFPLVLIISGEEHYLASPKNDYPVLLLGFIMGGQILRYLETRSKPTTAEIVGLSLIACASVTVKLSMAVFAGGLLLILLAMAPRRTLTVSVPVFALICGVWMVRGIILSGYPLYPSEFLPFPVDWRIPAERVQDEMNWVISWARIPDADLEETLGHTRWLSTWWEQNRSHVFSFILPLALGAGTLLGALTMMARRQALELLRSRLWLLPLIALVSLVYWFVTSPAVRFGWHMFWVLGTSMLIITLARIGWKVRPMALSLAAFLLAYAIVTVEWMPYTRSDWSRAPDISAELGYTYTDHGVQVYFPTLSDQCWSATLPCTPQYRLSPHLLLRDGATLENGFAIDPNVATTKGAYFALFDITQADDIVPAVTPSTQLPADGILLGGGWEALETYDGGQHRWINTDARFFITAPTLEHTTLCIDAAPGPSIPDKPVQLAVVDETGAAVQQFTVDEATTLVVNLPLAPDIMEQIFSLVVENSGEPTPDDGRILNMRVMDMYWCE